MSKVIFRTRVSMCVYGRRVLLGCCDVASDCGGCCVLDADAPCCSVVVGDVC